MTSSSRRQNIVRVLRVSSGNFLEMYDFTVFGYYAAAISHLFFPAKGHSEHADLVSLTAALMTFGAGFLARPLGAVVLGAYIDRKGRRAGLLLTLGLMSVGTLMVALMPGYTTIGVAAPVLVLISRLIQGFSAGAELGGVSVYLSEIATPGNKGFYVAWQSASQSVATIFAALLGVMLNGLLPADAMLDWGWRIPLLIGCALIPFLFILRSSLEETEAFLGRKILPVRELLRSVVVNWPVVVLGMMMVIMSSVSVYMITVYTPTFGKKVLHLTDQDGLVVTLCVGLSNLFWLPVSGAISDRIGRRPLLIATTVAAIASAYPAMHWLIGNPSFWHLIGVELWLSVIYGCYNGALIVYLTEIIPAHVRTSGFSIAYSLATVLGGMTPAICTALIDRTGDGAMPGAWMTCAAAVALLAVLLNSWRRRGARHYEESHPATAPMAEPPPLRAPA